MMRYLLDTHTALWSLHNTKKLSITAKSIIANTSNAIFLSVASAWEIAIKISKNKMDFNGGCVSFIRTMHENGVIILAVNASHVAYVESMPYIHNDPFDRLIISTAISEGMTLVTADEDIQKYDIPWVW